MNVGIIGCGLIGQKRARALGSARLVLCADTALERAKALAAAHGAVATADWRQGVASPEVDIVIVATTNAMLATVAGAAAAAGKHVLVEKPVARNLAEMDGLIAAAHRGGALVRAGYNHRYHPALQQARTIFQSGALGEPMFVRGRYGHGGRSGYEKEWRADPAQSGGGELIDQGVHLIDLARWFLGEFPSVTGYMPTYFWNMKVEDNAFLLLKTRMEPAGHGGASGRYDAIRDKAFETAWILSQVGITK